LPEEKSVYCFVVAGSEAFVDAHVHFWDHSVAGLSWAWLEPGFTHPRLGGLRQLDAPRFAAAEYRVDTAGVAVTKVVHVQAAKTADPVIETAWLQGMSDREGWPTAIVAYCDLARDDVADVIARHAAFSRFRGIRDIPSGTRLSEPAVTTGFAALAGTGITVEIMTSVEHFDALLALVRRHPDTTVVIGHSGLPVQRDDDYFGIWSAGMQRLGREPNTVCKISALAGADGRWSVAGIRRWVFGCLDAFGPQRCMFASNWPVDKLFTSYRELIDGYWSIVGALSEAERRAVFVETAERTYRI
jgi:predicted TIM-barrel fold metal-dependent hydrolase